MRYTLTTSLLFMLLLLGSCSNDYSSGYRQGLVMKFSRKGMINKTYEGIIDQGGYREEPNAHGVTMVQNTWEFSLDEGHHRNENLKELAATLEKAMLDGRRVQVHYHQESGTDPWDKRGETSYYVDSVKYIQ